MSLEKITDIPLIYSCSGCSSIAQLANRVAVELDREGVAEMSCIAGVGGGVKSLLKKAKFSKNIIALDGCQLHCVKQCLSQHGIVASRHYTLTDYGIKKTYHQDYLEPDFQKIKKMVKENHLPK